MNEQLQQLIIYIQQQLAAGVSETALRQTLKQYNWDDQSVHSAFQALAQSNPTLPQPQAPNQPSYTAAQSVNRGPLAPEAVSAQPRAEQTLSGRHIRKAVLWIISPLLILLIAVILNVILASFSEEPAILKTVATAAGAIGTIMLIIGPSIGIFKLYRHKR